MSATVTTSVNDPFVTVTTAAGSVEAEMIQDVLRQEGIEATIQGALHAGMLGAAGILLRVPVQVPASRAEEAGRIIQALERFDAVVSDDEEIPVLPPGEREAQRVRLEQLARGRLSGEGAYRAGPRAVPQRPDPRRKGVAFFAAFLFPGGGHFHARAPRVGWGIAATIVACFAGVAGGEWRALVSVGGLALADALGSLTAVDRFNGNATGSLKERLFSSLPFVAIAASLAWAIGPFAYSRFAPLEVAAPDIEQICQVVGRCTRAQGGAAPDAASFCRDGLSESVQSGDWTPQLAESCRRCVDNTAACIDIQGCRQACPRWLETAAGVSP